MKNIIINIIKSFYIVFMLGISFDKLNATYHFSINTSVILKNPTLLLVSFIGCFVIIKWISEYQYKTSIIQKLISLLFSTGTLFTDIYNSKVETVNQIIYGSQAGIIILLTKLLAYFMILEIAQKIIIHIYEKGLINKIYFKSSFFKKIANIYSKNPFKYTFICLSIIWLLIGITAFPMVFMGDTMDQVRQFFGDDIRRAGHPVVSTFFIGGLTKLGWLIGSANMGLFFVVLVQILFISFIFAYGVHLLVLLTKNTNYALIVTIIMAIIPMVHSTIIMGTKDVMFSGFFVLYLLTLFICIYDFSLFVDKKMYVVNGLSICLMLLFRYNTLHFIVLSLLLFFIVLIFTKRYRKNYLIIILISVVSLSFGQGINKVLVNQFVEEQPQPNRREMLSVPFQQTARYIKYHEEEITSEEREIINAVLDYDKIKENYNPRRADPVKRTHKEDATSEEMKAYFQLVVKQTFRHPMVTFESIAASHANLFNINQSVKQYYKNGIFVESEPRESYTKFADEIGLSDNPISLKLNNIRVSSYLLFDNLPIASQLNNYGIFVFGLFSMIGVYLRDRKYHLAIILFPCLAFIASLLAGPITFGYIRYILPIVLTVPLLFGFFFQMEDNEEFL